MAQITLNSTGVASDGSLVLQSNGTTAAISIGTNQNVNFPVSAQRITGDFSNATVASRVLLQSSTTNGQSALGLLPNGTSTQTQYIAFNSTDPANSSYIQTLISATEARINSGQLGTGTNLPMTFYTGGSERARIDTSGNLLVGFTSNPNTARMYVRYDGLTTQSIINPATTTSASTSWNHFIGQSGNGSSITTSNIFIRGNGNIENVNNSYGAISDVKLKENIIDASPKLEKLMQVRVRNYNFKGDYEQHKQLGVIAQELETVFPSIINETQDCDKDGKSLGTTTKSVKYSVFVPMLIKAMQEQQALIQSLTDRITALEQA